MELVNPGAQTVETARISNGPLLIFGQGPVIDRITRSIPRKTADGKTIDSPENVDVNFWSKNLAKAAAELYKRGQTSRVIVMGGRTGGEGYDSEAALIKRYLITKDTQDAEAVPEGAVITEEDSPDTIANLINLLNMKDAQGTRAEEKYQILGTPYHIPRIKILMQLFRVPFDNVFASDEVLRFVARTKADWEINPKTDLIEIEKRLDSQSNLYYQNQHGLERRDYADRLIHDDLWTRELLEYPESWLGRVADIKNATRIREILDQVEKLWPQVLQNKFGINRELDSPDEIRSKLTQIKKNPLSSEKVKKWIEQNKTIGWSKEVEARLDMLIGERRQSH